MPRIADVLWRDTLIDAAVFREWMMGIGRRSAETRIAHLLCEVFLRMKAVGLANGDACELPITQTELGDALGLSTVYVNRSLQELRGKRLIRLRGSVLTVDDWEVLKEVGEFDPTYLHLDGDAGGRHNPYLAADLRCDSARSSGPEIVKRRKPKRASNAPR